MMLRIFLFLAGFPFLPGCGQKQSVQDLVKTPATSDSAIKPAIARTFCKAVLPANRDDLAKPMGDGQLSRTLTHDTPPMDKEAEGFYSYLGAANEFKSICGFELPEWVDPKNGRYYITQHEKQFVSQARLQYQTDPSRVEELRTMVMRTYQERWPTNPPLISYPSKPDPAGPEYWGVYFKIIEKGKYLYNVSIGVNSDGSISVSNTRGPVGWDD